MDWKARMNRQKVKKLYSTFVRRGYFYEARRLLELLKYGSITLRLDDVSWNVQTALEDSGFSVWYSRNGNTARARI